MDEAPRISSRDIRNLPCVSTTADRAFLARPLELKDLNAKGE